MNTAVERCQAIRKAVAEMRMELSGGRPVSDMPNVDRAVHPDVKAMAAAIEAIAQHVTYGQVPEQEKPHT